jgi:hypothetical protein
VIVEFVAQWPASIHTKNLPKPSRMPYYDYMDLPSICEANSATLFSTCHLSKMTSPEFLTGRWMGYYTDHRRAYSIPVEDLFDTPMDNIQLLARPSTMSPDRAQSSFVEIDARSGGIDSHGIFSLEGQVHSYGYVQVVKRYLNGGWTWGWNGHVTPFGIVGSWGLHQDFGGYFWIWKEDWI